MQFKVNDKNFDGVCLVDALGNPISQSNRLPVEATNKALPVLSNTGTIGALNDYIEIAVPAGYNTVSGVFVDGNVRGSFEIQNSFDGANFSLLVGKRVDGANDTAAGFSYTSTSLTGRSYQAIIPSGTTHIRLVCTSYTSGTSTGKLYLSETTSVNFVNSKLQTGNSRVGFFCSRSHLDARKHYTCQRKSNNNWCGKNNIC